MIGMHQEVIATAPLYNAHEQWNATLNKTNRWFTESGDEISPGLAKRLAHYARRRLTDIGWGAAIEKCKVHIDAHSSYGNRPEDQTYSVKFQNEAGGSMGIQGILISKGWPTIDHGYFLDDQ
jgi:hypothetical protein